MLISVVMPVYNDKATIDRAVKSLSRQAHPHWELLAVDDGSTDGCYERLAEWGREDRRIRTTMPKRIAGRPPLETGASGPPLVT